MPGGRPPKPGLKLDEAAKALNDLQAAGEKVSGESLALQISKNRGAYEYRTPELRGRTTVSARWVIRELNRHAGKLGETQTTAKLVDFIRREQGRRNAEARAIQGPEPHQEEPKSARHVAGANRPEAASPANDLEVAKGQEGSA